VQPHTRARSTRHDPSVNLSRVMTKGLADFRYVRAPVPLHFPESAEMPEHKIHLSLRTFLYQLLRFALGPGHSVGSEQLVYWLATNPRRCLAPDLFLKRDIPDTMFGTWKTWHHGAPDLAVEIVSPSEGGGLAWEEKLEGYREMGVGELVRFDPEAPEGARLRIWDRLEEDLVERVVTVDRAQCVTLGWIWIVCPIEECPVGLRLEEARGELVMSASEVERAESRKARAESQDARAESQDARARVQVLEEELAKLRAEREIR